MTSLGSHTFCELTGWGEFYAKIPVKLIEQVPLFASCLALAKAVQDLSLTETPTDHLLDLPQSAGTFTCSLVGQQPRHSSWSQKISINLFLVFDPEQSHTLYAALIFSPSAHVPAIERPIGQNKKQDKELQLSLQSGFERDKKLHCTIYHPL